MNDFAKKLNTQISEYYSERLHKDFILKDIDNIVYHVQEQKKYEKKYLHRSRICNKNGSLILSDIDVDNISEKMQHNFYDVNFMESLRCIINLITDSSIGDTQERIRFFFNNLRQFGAPSSNGIALKSSLREKSNHYKSDFLVLKSPQNPSKSTELLHEAVVGFSLNKLRSEIPNFSYVYDVFDCSVPIVNISKEVQLWCTSYDTPVSYVVYEYIQNSVSMSDAAKKISSRDLFLYYLQVLMACNIAHQCFDFTHYDLHNENVLIRKYSDNPFYIRYPFKESNYYVYSPGGIATMIDYGMSHLRTEDGFDIGILNADGFFSRNDVYADSSHIIGDAYKLLGFILYGAVTQGNKDLYNIGISLFSFFFQDPESSDFENMNVETFERIVKDQRKNFFQLPFVSEFNFSLETYIEYVIRVLQKEFPEEAEILITLNPPNPVDIFGCNKNCLSVRESLVEFHLQPSQTPSFFEIYDDRENPKKIMLSIFLKNTQQSIQKENEKIQKIVDFEIPSIYIINQPVSDDETGVFLVNNFTLFNENVISLLEILNNYQLIESYINNLSYLVNLQEISQKADLLNLLKAILAELKIKKTRINKIIMYAKNPVYRLSLLLERAFSMLKNPIDEIITLNDSYRKLNAIILKIN
jgi:hypothetical protein